MDLRNSPPLGVCAATVSKAERQSGSKALESGSFRLWGIVTCIKPNVFMRLVHLNPNG
jgi:hypothetical protein